MLACYGGWKISTLNNMRMKLRLSLSSSIYLLSGKNLIL